MAKSVSQFDYLLRADRYISTYNRKKLIALIANNLTDYDIYLSTKTYADKKSIAMSNKPARSYNYTKATHAAMMSKRRFTNDFLQLVANILMENTQKGVDKYHYIHICEQIALLFKPIAYEKQYEYGRFDPLNNLYFLFLCNLYCSLKRYLMKDYHGLQGIEFISVLLEIMEQSAVTGEFYLNKAQYAELFVTSGECDPIEAGVQVVNRMGEEMYQLSNSSLKNAIGQVQAQADQMQAQAEQMQADQMQYPMQYAVEQMQDPMQYEGEQMQYEGEQMQAPATHRMTTKTKRKTGRYNPYGGHKRKRTQKHKTHKTQKHKRKTHRTQKHKRKTHRTQKKKKTIKRK
jgi:hypothetical protein